MTDLIVTIVSVAAGMAGGAYAGHRFQSWLWRESGRAYWSQYSAFHGGNHDPSGSP